MALTVTLTIDAAAAMAHWTSAKQLLGDLPSKAQNVQAAIGSVSISGAAGATAGTVTFTTNAATLRTQLANLLAALQGAEGEVSALIAALDAGLGVTVNQVT